MPQQIFLFALLLFNIHSSPCSCAWFLEKKVRLSDVLLLAETAILTNHFPFKNVLFGFFFISMLNFTWDNYTYVFFSNGVLKVRLKDD